MILSILAAIVLFFVGGKALRKVKRVKVPAIPEDPQPQVQKKSEEHTFENVL